MVQSKVIEIRQHNAITTARYDYSACQLDILFYLLSQLKKEDNLDMQYRIYNSNIEKMTGRTWNYQQLREATEDMGSRMFSIEDNKEYRQMWMFQEVKYNKGQGCFDIILSKSIRPFLFELKSNFTSYQLHSALNLSSKYAKRIYQLASQWKDIGETCIYSLEDFKMMLGIKDIHGKKIEQFERISDLKKKVLDIAVKQITEHTEFKIDYRLIKQGRSFTGIRFYINTQKTKALPIQFENPIEETRYQNARQVLENLGIKNNKLIHQIISNEDMLDTMFKFNYDLKIGQVKADRNPGGLLLTILGLR